MSYQPKYFKPEEFHCNCGCGLDYSSMKEDVLRLIDKIREEYGKPLHINSSIRCKEYNRIVGGVPRSQHLLGKACDLSPVRPTAKKYKRLCKIANRVNPKGGVGYYPRWGFVHVDSRKERHRWSK